MSTIRLFSCLLFLMSFTFNVEAKAKKEKKQDKQEKVDEKTVLEETDYFMEACRFKMLSDYNNALKLFEKTIEINPNNAAAWFELANLYLASNQKEKALLASEKSIELAPNNKWYKTLYGDVLSKTGKFDKAAKLYEKAVKENPKNIENYFEWAFMLVNAGQYKEAIEVYNDIEKKMGVSEEISLEKEKIFLKINDVKSAAAELKKLIATNPSEVRYQLILGEVYMVNGFKKEARDIYNEVLKNDPSNPYALMALANMYKQEGDKENYEKAIINIIQNPKAELDVKIAYLYTGLQRFQQLTKEEKGHFLKLSQVLVKAHPNEAKANAVMADFYYLSDSNKMALNYYRKSLSVQSNVFTVWQQFFSILMEEKMFEEMRDSSARALELYPTQAPVYYFNGLANYYLKNYEVANKRFLKTIQMSGDNLVLKGQIFALLGDSYHELKRFEESDKAYEDAINLDAKNAYAMNNYAYHLSVRGQKLKTAEEMSKKSLELQPNTSSFLDTYAWILFKQGKFAEARTYQEKALEVEKEDRNTLLEHYGDILYQLGEKDKAYINWQKALDTGNGSPLLKRKVQEKKYISEDVQ